ncbi:MAG: SMP-30/gluconolactonase/LRE family protein [Verrucomicrobia bacterium]|nr:SMP-30/gluconolactonase/LRE family protein [Verrucomicrobiota bacterium]
MNFAVSLTALSTVICSAAEVEILHDQGKAAIEASASIKKLAGGFKFVEGPVWVPKDGGFLVFSDIPANELKQWKEGEGVSVFRLPSKNANGNTLDLKDRLVTAEHSARRISFTTRKDNIKTVVDEHDGKKFNSPNDVVVKSDGSFWFTDPDYGLPKDATKEMPGNFIYRFDGTAKTTTVLVKDFDKPNGLCFSPDEKRLYIADSGKPHHIRVFDVAPDHTLVNGRVFCVIQPGGPDGIRCDAAGRVWSSTGNGLQVFSPEGTLLVKVNTPEAAANLCFGGKDGKTVFITARTSLYAIETKTQAAPRPTAP